MARAKNLRKSIYEQLARVGKAVASPSRLELLDLLRQGPANVEALSRKAGLTVANASQHLQALRPARLVEADKQGLYVIYRLADEQVCDFYRALRSLAERRLAEIEQTVRQFMEDRDSLEVVDKTSLLERVHGGAVTVLDVRPEEEYRAGHIPRAISVPLGELEDRLAELPKKTEVVAYCRGPYCVLAIQAVEMLRAHGFQAIRLDDGVPEWRASGYSVAVGEQP